MQRKVINDNDDLKKRAVSNDDLIARDYRAEAIEAGLRAVEALGDEIGNEDVIENEDDDIYIKAKKIYGL